MAKPNSRTTFIDYCLRQLGAPVIEINVDDDQVDDRVDEALQFYQHYHADAIEKVYLKHKITNSELTLSASDAGNFTVGEIITGGTSGASAIIVSATGTKITYNSLVDFSKVFTTETITGTDSSATATIASIVKGDIENGYIPITDAVTDVVTVMPISDANVSNNMFDIQYQIMLNDMYNLGFMGQILDYQMKMQHLALLDMILDSDDKHISFDRHKNQLRIDMNWQTEVVVDTYIVVECYRIIDPDTYTDVYNDYYLKKYATALIKKQWGQNLLKFEGMTMPGGVQFNGRQLYEDALQDIEKLEEEVRLNWEQPVDFYTG